MDNNLVRLPQGVSDFKELVQGSYKFVDKTAFIRDVINDGSKIILITRPRRFGKTLNMSMLQYFLQATDEQDKNLFKNLEISKDSSFCLSHQNQYPVLFISFKDIKRSNYIDAYADIVELVRDLYAQHRYLLETTVLHDEEKQIFMSLLKKEASSSDVKTAIKQLSVYLHREFKQSTIILIDEYDTPIQEAYLKSYYLEMTELMRGILGVALKDNTSLSKSVLTGITRVSQESLFSGLNNISVYSLLREKYGQYFGFTESEVIKLIAETKQKVPMHSIKEWYNGYQVGKYVLYNPWSIISCLANDGLLQPYWVNTASNDLIGKLLTKADSNTKQQFEELLQGKVIEQPLSESLVFPDIETRQEALWSLLLYAGYLKVLSSKLGNYQLMATIAIPNKEVGFVYDQTVANWFSTAVSLESYDTFVQTLHNGDLEKFKMYLSSYIMQTGSYFDFNSNTSEQIFHLFILGLVVGLRSHYTIYSNRESGFGRCDVILIPHDKQRQGILLEFKTSEKPELLQDKAKEALEQIKDKQYLEEFMQHGINSALVIGLAFCGKQMDLAYESLKLV
jgi:hypothetical protein